MFLADPEYFYGSRRTSSSGAPNGVSPNPAGSGADGAVDPGAGSVSRTSPFAASTGGDPGVAAADVQAEGSGLPASIADDYPPAGTKDLAQQAVYDDLPSTEDAPDRSRYEDTFDPSSTPQVKSAYEPASTPIEYELGSTYYDPSTELDNEDLPPGTGGRGASSDAPIIPPTVTSLGPPPLPTTTGPSKKNPWYNSLTSCFRGRDQDGNAC
ncbi:MAG: hypothetical protein M1825_006532 [Sarcosagium campestre]|nr:MAG: hypothetical protein M1825_006532 [Sarcosagium campestre]